MDYKVSTHFINLNQWKTKSIVSLVHETHDTNAFFLQDSYFTKLGHSKFLKIHIIKHYKNLNDKFLSHNNVTAKKKKKKKMHRAIS